MSALLSADSFGTQGSNITFANITSGNASSTWYGLCGNVSGAAPSNVTLNATAGAINCSFTPATGSSSCSNGATFINLLFSNSSVNATTLAGGNLTVLDAFINRSSQNGTSTFITTATFQTAGYGNIGLVPTTYTNPSAAQDFPIGYLQDQSGNLVFITTVAAGKTGYNGSAVDFQAILPTKDGQNTTYYMGVDISCNNTPPPPPPPPPAPGGGGNYLISPGVSIRYYATVPPANISPVPPNISQIRLLAFTPYREASPGDQVVVDPLLNNPSDAFVTVGVGLSGASAALSTPARNVLLAPHSKQTVPFSMNLPSDMPGGYYIFSVEISLNNSNVSYPTIIRVVPVYRVGEPVVHRQFLLDYENKETTVVLTVTNTAKDTIPHLQVFESLPSKLAGIASEINFTSEAGGNLGGDISGTMNGPNIRWDLENIHPSESRSIFYRIPGLVTDMTDYPTWNLAQIVSISSIGTTDILISGLLTPTMLPGDKGEMSMSLFNAGVLDRDVDVDIIPPAGWRVTPLTLTLSLPSRQSEDLKFLVESPSSSDAGTYGFTIRVKYSDTFYDKTAYLYINKPIVQVFAPPLTDQLTAFFGANILPIAFVLAAGSLMIAGLYFAFRFINSPRFDEGRLADMQNMERMFDQKIIGKKKGM